MGKETDKTRGPKKVKTSKPIKKVAKTKAPKIVYKKKTTAQQQRKIPRQTFTAALEFVKNPANKASLEQAPSCLTYIHTGESKDTKLTAYTYLKYARMFLLRRDMNSLSKLLSFVNPYTERSTISLFPVFVKYGAACMANGDGKLLQSFCNAILESNDVERMMRVCTTYDKTMDADEELQSSEQTTNEAM